MNLKITNKRALVTGATGGIGEETVKGSADEGVTPFFTDIKDSETNLKRISKKYSCDYAVSDLGTSEGVNSFVDEVGFDFDILVHTAGITGEIGDPLNMSEDGLANALKGCAKSVSYVLDMTGRVVCGK
mgnify:CR=1 FL=1